MKIKILLSLLILVTFGLSTLKSTNNIEIINAWTCNPAEDYGTTCKDTSGVSRCKSTYIENCTPDGSLKREIICSEDGSGGFMDKNGCIIGATDGKNESNTPTCRLGEHPKGDICVKDAEDTTGTPPAVGNSNKAVNDQGQETSKNVANENAEGGGSGSGSGSGSGTGTSSSTTNPVSLTTVLDNCIQTNLANLNANSHGILDISTNPELITGARTECENQISNASATEENINVVVSVGQESADVPLAPDQNECPFTISCGNGNTIGSAGISNNQCNYVTLGAEAVSYTINRNPNEAQKTALCNEAFPPSSDVTQSDITCPNEIQCSSGTFYLNATETNTCYYRYMLSGVSNRLSIEKATAINSTNFCIVVDERLNSHCRSNRFAGAINNECSTPIESQTNTGVPGNGRICTNRDCSNIQTGVDFGDAEIVTLYCNSENIGKFIISDEFAVFECQLQNNSYAWRSLYNKRFSPSSEYIFKDLFLKKVSAQSSAPTPETIDPSQLENGSYTIEIPGYKNVVINVYSDSVKIKYFEDLNGDGKKNKNEKYLDPAEYSIKVANKNSIIPYELEKGWNLISLKFVNPDLDSAKELAKTLYSQGIPTVQVSKYDSGNWVHFVYRLDENKKEVTYGNDFTLVPGEGYFVRTLSGGIATLKGKTFKSSVPISFVKGWNLLGVQSPTKYTAKSFLDFCKAQGLSCKEMSKYVDGSYKSIVELNGAVFGKDFDLLDKEGYFVKNEAGSKVINP